MSEITGTDAEPAVDRHNDACEQWCNHCSLCGDPIMYGARCNEHLGVYPDRKTTDNNEITGDS